MSSVGIFMRIELELLPSTLLYNLCWSLWTLKANIIIQKINSKQFQFNPAIMILFTCVLAKQSGQHSCNSIWFHTRNMIMITTTLNKYIAQADFHINLVIDHEIKTKWHVTWWNHYLIAIGYFLVYALSCYMPIANVPEWHSSNNIKQIRTFGESWPDVTLSQVPACFLKVTIYGSVTVFGLYQESINTSK